MSTREQLKLYIEKNGVTQTHIAKEIGVSRSMLNMYLHNTRKLNVAKQKELENFLAEKGIN